MDAHQVFNILLLTLSLATVLLTLVSYGIYKLRQLPAIRGSLGTAQKINGVFFRRYVPVRLDGLAHDVAARRRTPFAIISRNVGVFFGIVAVVIFCSLAIQNYFTSYSMGEKGASAHLYLELQKQGLLHSYDYSPIVTAGILDEKLPPGFESAENQLVAQLQKHTVVLVQTAANKGATPELQRVTAAGWLALLDSAKIRHRVQEKVEGVSAGELLLLSEQRILTAAERAEVSGALKRGAGVLATGSVGTRDVLGLLDNAGLAWTQDQFGVKLILNPHPEVSLPTIFASNRAPWWDAPPGLLLEWFPPDSSFVAVGTSGVQALFASSYRGFPEVTSDGSDQPTPRARANFLIRADGSRTAWLGVGPTVMEKNTAAENAYVRSALLHSLGWAEHVEQARVANWHGGKVTAAVFAVDSEDKFENVEQQLAIFRKAAFPSTFFVVSNLFQKYPDMMKGVNDNVEIASHSENHDTFEQLAQQQQFDRIQTSRLEIEELSKKPVQGFRPPVEKYNDDTVAATLANRLAYFAGDGHFFRFAPLYVAGGRLLFFPRVTSDDFSIHQRRDLANGDEIVRVLSDDYEHVRLLGGLYFFSMHTQIFGLPLYKAPLAALLRGIDGSGGVWKANFRQLNQWVRSRDLVTTQIVHDGGKSVLNVSNGAAESIDGLVIQVDMGSGQPRSVPVPKLEAGKEARIDL